MKKLERKLTLTAIIAISIAGMLGGIFVLPGLAAAKTGSSIWLAFLLAAICILPAVLSKSELATAMPSSGGAYVYIERALGPIFGTISGLGLWLSLLLKSAFALVGFGAYLLVLVNINPNYIKYISILFLSLIMILNIKGVKKVGKVQIVIVSFSLISLLFLIFSGFPKISDDLLDPFLIKGNIGLISTIAFVFIAYAGVTKIAAIAGEIKNPEKNIPKAMIISLFSISIIYIIISYVLVGNIELNYLSTDIKPLYTLSINIGGEILGYIISIIAIFTLISMANSGVLASSRFPFAMAMDKLLPEKLTRVHNKYLTPINTILLTCLIMSLVILFLDVEKIAKLASAFKVLMFIIVNLCVIVLRETAVQWYKPTYKSPLYPYVQIFGIISGIILIFYLGWLSIISVLIVIIIGTLIYFLYGNKAERSRGVLRNYGLKPAQFLFLKKNINNENENNKENENNSWLDGKINKNANVIVPLLGNEFSSETLVEIGSAINNKEEIQVVNIKEVPDQTFLDALLEETPHIKSIKRQLNVVREVNNIKLDFESILTYNITDTISTISDYSKTDWIILSWDGRDNNGIFINNPVGWIVSNITSNFALYKDNGVRYIKKIILAVRPDSVDIEKLVLTSINLCKFYNAKLTLLHVVSENIRKNSIDRIKEKSNKLINNKLDICSLRIEKSSNPSKCVSELTAEYDLLVIGTPKKETLKTMLFGTGKDKFATSSNCSVLRITIKN